MSGTPVRVVYLGGLGRSGTTLIERLLAELPGVCAAGEVVHLWQRGLAEDERCGCGEPFGACGFWTGVGQAAFGGWDEVSVGQIATLRQEVDRTRHIPRLARGSLNGPARQHLADYTSYYLRLYQAIAQVGQCQAVIDSSKHASLAFCLSKRPEIDLRVIHVVRDSRAVAHSWASKVERPDSATRTYMTTYSPMRAAGQWNAENGAFQMLARRGVPVLRVRYEDLVGAPERMIRQMAGFAGLPGDLDLDFIGADGHERWARLRPAHTASGNPIRFATGKLTIRPDERWRSAMPEGQRRTVTALTLPLLSHYGYVGVKP
ncbi:MAG: sulfotransferase family protein [Streptosporangiaceae bacterium]